MIFQIINQMGESRSEWDQLGLTDLTHFNAYVQDKLLTGGYHVQFHALSVNWTETIGPSIPDSR